MQEKPGLEETVELMKDLRRRCEWDAAQTHESLRPYLLEEAYEVDDAIRSGNDGLLREELERQVRVSGIAERTSAEESKAYFDSRPEASRIGAWASKQSRFLSDRKELEERVNEIRARFADEIPYPEFWGGYRIAPTSFEFWQGRPSRLHDRICYEKEGATWNIFRVYP